MDRADPLENKTALVTGAAQRLGRATALSLAERGVNVVIHYRSSAGRAEALADQVRNAGVKAWTVSADLADPAAAEHLFSRACSAAGSIDYLVNNASVFLESHLVDFAPADLARNVNINALAPLLIARSFAAQQREGAIINMLDCRITDYDRAHAAYHISKRMLYSLTRMMALEFAPSIRVNAVAPGLVLPPSGRDDTYLEGLAHTTPLNRHGAPSDVTAAILFLLESDFVTGQVLFVDGGRHLRGSVYG